MTQFVLDANREPGLEGLEVNKMCGDVMADIIKARSLRRRTLLPAADRPIVLAVCSDYAGISSQSTIGMSA
ncbi:hypothetical protein Y032_0018g3677 [Ancylostoma ceylanicum]|uniref:Uncharacterized protein n=1 Tax=Ancylostoma ceylanicum TaxID=53326 RepID=A0A016V492_9BILA|nr:hypothetical protein Y032_0018g3677 [Ancylostoma ceylanicum]